MIVDTLIEKIIATQNPTCVGLDTALEYLPEEMQRELEEVYDRAAPEVRSRLYFRRAAQMVFAFNRNIIDSVYDIVPAVKVQIAYYEELGPYGVMAFEKTIKYAKARGLVVITDAKRNDIGATAARYANAFLGAKEESGVSLRLPRADFPSDFLTVNGYLGSDGITPFVEACKAHDKGIFVLVKTSNPSSSELQDLTLTDGRTVYECMGDMVAAWGKDTVGKYGYSAVGAVVGATHPAEAAVLRRRLPHTFFLIPGYGAQGGNAEMLKNCFSGQGMGGIVNNSRGILCAYKKRGGTYYEAARAACLAMQADLASVLGEICVK